MPPECDVSVIVCTYNRADLLGDTLNDIRDQIATLSRSAELVIVNNNSTDGTEEVVQAFLKSAPFPVKYRVETRQGHTIARNTALALCAGAIIVFTDDDVRLAPGWLENLCAGFAAAETMAMGGKIVPVWPENVPDWIESTDRPHFPGVVVQYDLGEQPLRIGRGESCPLGANMAFRREVFTAIGQFREDLGHRGKLAAGGDDMEFFHRFLQTYPYIAYIPDAVVYHPVPDNRLDKTYFLNYLYNASKNQPLYETDVPVKKVFGMPRYMIRAYLQHTLLLVYYSLRANKPRSFFHLGSLYQIRGYLAGVMALKKLRSEG
jgi:glucosyl-dolichyl phosphate glucuronosyltransferase